MENITNLASEKKLASKTVFLVLIVVFIIGLVLTLSSTSIGISAGRAALMNNNGSMDTMMYEYIMSNTALSYSIVGAILALISGVGALLVGFATYKKKA